MELDIRVISNILNFWNSSAFSYREDELKKKYATGKMVLCIQVVEELY
jgi:hypothetical protein